MKNFRFKYIGYNPYIDPEHCDVFDDNPWIQLNTIPRLIPRSAIREGFYYVTTGKDRIHGYLLKSDVWYKIKNISKIDMEYEFLMYRRELTNKEFHKLCLINSIDENSQSPYWNKVYEVNLTKRSVRSTLLNGMIHSINKDSVPVYLYLKLR